jgi:hypothetical protein
LISGKFRSSSCRDQNQSGNWGAQRQREPSRAQPSPAQPSPAQPHLMAHHNHSQGGQ